MKNLLKTLGLTVLVMVAFTAIAQIIQWYSTQPSTTSLLDSDIMVAERASPQAYRSFTLASFKAYIGTNGPAVVIVNLQYVTNQFVNVQYVTYQTNQYQYVTNQYVTFNTNNYSYVTNEYVTYSTNQYQYVTNQFVTYSTNVYQITTNLYATFATNFFLSVTTNIVEYSIITNLSVKNLTIIDGLNMGTNVWANYPTGAVALNVFDQYVRTYTPMSITGITAKSNNVAEPIVMTITNAAASNVTMTLDPNIAIPDRTHSFTVSNGSFGVFSLRYHPLGGTNGIWKQW